MFVSVLDGYIHVEPMKTRHHQEYVAAYKITLNFFARLGRRPTFQRLDNETSGPLEAFAIANNITIQYCPPHTHRSLKAERAIRTFKNHFIATLCTAAPDLPLTLWDEFLPQIEIQIISSHMLQTALSRHTQAFTAELSTSQNIPLHLSALECLYTINLLSVRLGLCMVYQGST